MWAVLKRTILCAESASLSGLGNLLGAGVLGDSLGALRHGVLGQFTGEKQTNGGLDFSARDGRALVVVRKTRRFGGDTLEDVVDERVHDGHGFGGHASVGVDLTEHLVDVDSVRLPPFPAAFLVSGCTLCLRLGGGLLRSLACCFRRHDNNSRFNGESEKNE